MSSHLYLWDRGCAPFEPIDRLVKLWGQVVVPIFVDNPKSIYAVNGLGSGFLFVHEENLFLVTALHVVQDANLYRHQIANIADKAVSLSGLSFKISGKDDIAVAHLSNEWLSKNEITSVKGLPAVSKSNMEATEMFLLLGYPGSKNKLHSRFGKDTRKMLSITTERSTNTSVKTLVDRALFFSYDPKQVVNSALVNLGPPPALQGMSGGPALQVLIKHELDGTLKFALSCVGVLSRWLKKHKTVVASPLSAVEDLIAQF